MTGARNLAVEPATELTSAQKLAASLDLFAYGCLMMRENLRRAHPGADDARIDALLLDWLRTRRGARRRRGACAFMAETRW